MIVYIRVAVLLACAIAAILLSRMGRPTRTVCGLLSLFVAVGTSTFFSQDEIVVTVAVSSILFFGLILLTGQISRRADKTEGRNKKPV